MCAVPDLSSQPRESQASVSKPRSRRTRRRLNRWERLGMCSRQRGAVPSAVDASCVGVCHATFTSTIEPSASARGAPRTQAVTVFPGRWSGLQEEVGPLARGPGGPLTLGQSLGGPSQGMVTQQPRPYPTCGFSEATGEVAPMAPPSTLQRRVTFDDDRVVVRPAGSLRGNFRRFELKGPKPFRRARGLRKADLRSNAALRRRLWTNRCCLLCGLDVGSDTGGEDLCEACKADLQIGVPVFVEQALSASTAEVTLWKSVATGLERCDEDGVFRAVSALEDSGFLKEDTFEWTAAELALESFDDKLGNKNLAAVSAVTDVIGNRANRQVRGPLSILSFNATSWRKDIAEWCAMLKPDLVLVQETHLAASRVNTLAQHVGIWGYKALVTPACATGNGGTSGGLAILHRSHLDVRHVHQFVVEGAGFLAAALRVKGCDVFVVTVYLKYGEGFQSRVNATVLSHLIPFVRSVRGTYFVAGDFNEDFDTLAETQIADEARGTWVGVGSSTLVGGGQIDYGLVGKALSP